MLKCHGTVIHILHGCVNLMHSKGLEQIRAIFGFIPKTVQILLFHYIDFGAFKHSAYFEIEIPLQWQHALKRYSRFIIFLQY